MVLPKEIKKAVLLHVIHRPEQRKLMQSVHSTFESTSMACKFLLALSKVEPWWLTDRFLSVNWHHLQKYLFQNKNFLRQAKCN